MYHQQKQNSLGIRGPENLVFGITRADFHLLLKLLVATLLVKVPPKLVSNPHFLIMTQMLNVITIWTPINIAQKIDGL